ncbi:MAG: CBS domain-containing protein [Cytophagales bacterium]
MNKKNLIINTSESIEKALIKIDKNNNGFVFTCNDNNQIVGIATDGDIRRQLIKNHDLNQKIENCMNKNFVFVTEDTPTENIYKKFDKKINIIPVIGPGGELVSLYTKDNLPKRDEVETSSRAKSPVRISFGGGGSDTTTYFSLQNGAVINATISLYSYASLYKRKDMKISIDSLDLNKSVMVENIDQINSIDNDFNLITSVIKTIKPDFGFDLIINSDFPKGSGLGGSSAVCSSIIGCFNEFRIDKWNDYEIAEIAYESERLRLDVAGGWQDQYATVFGGINFMEFKEAQNLIHPLRISNRTLLELENNLILCYTNSNHKDDSIHRDQKNKTENQEIIDNIKLNVELCYKTRDTLLKGKLDSFGDILNKTWALKKTFANAITNPFLDKIYNNALKNGAIGGKLLGAGGGGYFIFYINSKEKNKFLKWMRNEKLIHTPFKFVEEGLKSWIIRE